MENIFCGLCKSIVGESVSVCPNCQYPIKGTVEEKSKFRMKLVDVQFWMKDVDAVREFTRRISVIFSLVGTLILVVNFSKYVPIGILFLAIGGIYAVLYFWSKTNRYLPFLLLPIFYFIHTAIEFFNNLLPHRIFPFRIEDSWIGLGPIAIAVLPYIYGGVRIFMIWYFIKGFLSVQKLKDNSRLVEIRSKVNRINY